MSRPILILSALVIVLAGALGYVLVSRPASSLNEAQVRQIVAEMTASDQDPAKALGSDKIDPATLHPMIESYLMANPEILERMSVQLRQIAETKAREEAKVALAGLQDKIYDDQDHVVIGNPEGDVTLVELFDYNCGYCRAAMPDLVQLIDDNPDLKVILKEFPILSQDSVDAARIAIAANRQGIDYMAFHTALFTARGKVTKQTALDAAEELGLNPVSLELEAQSADINGVIQTSYDIAQGLGASGTPTFIIGNEVIPGAVGKAELQFRIENMRLCGDSQCPADGENAQTGEKS